MRIKHLQENFAVMLLVSGVAFSSYGYANTLTIDSFTHVQAVSDRGDSAGPKTNTVTNLTGTDLTHASRIFTATATAGGFADKEDIVSGGNLLNISNSSGSAGTASIIWSFDAIDFTRHGNAILLDVVAIDNNANVEMIANETVSSGVKSFSGSGSFLVNFSDFTDGSIFANVKSFSLNFSGPRAWDGQFRISTTFASPVPLPPSFALMGSVLIGVLGVFRRKTKLISNA